MKNSLQAFLATKLALLCLVCVILGIIQALSVDQAALNESAKIWRLPQPNGQALSPRIRRVCGWPSIIALVIAPLAAALASLAFDLARMRALRSLRERGFLTRFDNFFLQFQSVLVTVLLFGNVILGGAFTTALFSISDLASLIAAQTLLACIAFASSTLAMLSESASQQKN